MVRKNASGTDAVYFHVAADLSCAAVTAPGTIAFERLATGPPTQPVEKREREREMRGYNHKMMTMEIILPTFTAQTGSRVSPTKNVTSHSSGMEARNFISSARPVLFSNIDMSGSSRYAAFVDVVAMGSGILAASAVVLGDNDGVIGEK